MLPSNVLRYRNFSLVLIAGNNLWRIVPQLIVAKRPNTPPKKIVSYHTQNLEITIPFPHF